MKKTPIHAPSLAQHFDAPLDQVAEFGWVCGYSADAAFLDNALERFTRQSQAQRAWLGRPWMGLVLDLGNPAISPTDVPGLVHFRQRADARPKFHLLHAKVALLGFRKPDDAQAWTVRLIVSTGNWTRQTVEESLDLAWRVDVRAADLTSGDESASQAVSDVAQAWRFFERLLPLFDDRLPGGDGAGAAAVAAQARARVESWLQSCARVRSKPIPRFFDSHDGPLLAQLPDLVKKHAGEQRRNYLAMGSGYFEAPATDGAFPEVPLAVRATLQGEGLLTQSPEVDLFVNPKACQAIATTREDALKAARMTIRAPRAPAAIFGASRARTLHAKFIFSANSGRGDQTCASPWLYLGSGNLTGAGFMRPAASGGNLEAGVVLGLSDLCWYAKDARGPDRRAVEHLLPVGWEGNKLSLKEIVSGDPFPERAEESLAPPVPWLQWEPAPPGGLLRAPSGLDDTTAQPDYEVLDAEGQACARDGADAFRWPGERPREVDLRWTPHGKARRIDRIPVLDECGRVAATPLPTLDLEAARWQLLDFPNAPEPEGDDSELEGLPDSPPEGAARAGAGAAKGYPIRDMMALIELIADRQTRIAEPDWAAWCARLEQTLAQTADDPAVSAFRGLKLNPLQPLRLPPFRPSYAESQASEAGKRYEELLDRIERAWNVADLPPIGEAP